MVNEKYGSKYYNILALVDLLLTLPAATAIYEQGFSQMKRTKTEYRNKLVKEFHIKIHISGY